MNVTQKITKIKKACILLERIAERCTLCGHKCKVNRRSGETGKCGAGDCLKVYNHFPHMGEEPPISGKNGSGTIFFSGCNMACVYCQNNQFSQKEEGTPASAESLAEIMLQLQKDKCHNINLVSPTHIVYKIIPALKIAYEKGLSIPVVYNTGGYDSIEAIKALDGVVDIYLPDMRYSDDKWALKYSGAAGYVPNNRQIVSEMLRQTGQMRISNNVIVKGVIIRLLILPGMISGTGKTLKYIAGEFGTDTFISVMSQYYPTYKAGADDVLKTRISRAEYDRVIGDMNKVGIKNGWVQPFFDNVDDIFAGENF